MTEFDDDGVDVTTEQTDQALKAGSAQVIDVREQDEWDAGHIDGVRHVPMGDLQEQAGTIDPERPVIFSCRSGGRSTMAAQAFRAAGYRAFSLDGGLLGWVAEGRPITPEGGHVASH